MKHINFKQHLKEIMNWHFSPKTGSPFWLDMRGELNFDPLNDICLFENLSSFPDISEHLRNVRVHELQPKGMIGSSIAGVFESGGTTGAVKRVLVYEDWLTQLVHWRVQNTAQASGVPRNTLAIIPSGPHVVGAINCRRAQALGGQMFTIDMDPRWVKKLVKAKDMDGVNAYTNHLIDQAESIISTQLISYLVATPLLLEAIARRPALVKHLNETLDMITWGGTHMDPDTLDYLSAHVFPNVTVTASYGSTMILSETKARMDQHYRGLPIFDSFAPYVVLDVVHPDSGATVGFQERGQVVMHHLSKYALIPNTRERDTAIKLPTANGAPGAAVCDIQPLTEVSGWAIIEGVY